MRLKSSFKRSRSLGFSIHGQANDSFKKRNYKPGQHGPNGSRSISEYGSQLKMFQALKFYHGISSTQLVNYFNIASSQKGNPSDNLFRLLNSRLDINIFRAFCHSFYTASQLVSHGHVMVNGKKVNVRSYVLKQNDIISIKSSANKVESVELAKKQNKTLPEYLSKSDNDQVTFIKVPDVGLVDYGFKLEMGLIVEFCSR